MYVTTFYSFKGGVGRTMAMVNCAFELAKKGQRVLLVDFDLEAPGVDAFLHPYGARKSKGLVDFITDYRVTRQAPHVSDYIYEAGPPGARVYVMPAGRRDDTYSSRLNRIEWGQLYAEEDGFLLFEDLKAQWEDFVGPDYVFIDSRTGHTDVSGICTRQLPDAVVLLFRLDPQNLEGLRPVVGAIRGEAKGPRKKNIHLHFVPSNVPDMDDENEILDKQLRNFREKLAPAQLDPIIRHYGDLEMLEHKVFTIERENSRLSKEYKELVDSVIRQNPEDLAGAKDFLSTILKSHRYRSESSTEQSTQIDAIADKHCHDPDILRMLARLREREGRFREAIAFLSDAIAASPTTTDSYAQRAELYAIVGDEESAKSDLRSALANRADSFYSVSRLVSMIQQMEPALLDEIPRSNALQSLSPESQVRLAESVMSESGSSHTTVRILKEIIQNGDPATRGVLKARGAVSLPLIAEGAFGEVVEILAEPKGIEDAFNLAMATWGVDGEITQSLFERVRELDDEGDSTNRDANYEFCLALTSWALQDNDVARARLTKARSILRDRSVTFSPWRYQYVDADDFRTDLDAAAQLFAGADVKPIVFQQTPWYMEAANA